MMFCYNNDCSDCPARIINIIMNLTFNLLGMVYMEAAFLKRVFLTVPLSMQHVLDQDYGK